MDEQRKNTQNNENIRSVSPSLPADVRFKLHSFIQVKLDEDPENLSGALRRLHKLWKDDPYSTKLRSIGLVVADLIDQGWRVDPKDDAVELEPPGLRLDTEDTDAAKTRLRKALRIGRDRQLEKDSVQRFLRRMEGDRQPSGNRGSVLDIVDDGADLARRFSEIRTLSAAEQEQALATVVDPVVQLCENGRRCEVTGLKLTEIWRYFRHTWSLEYRSIPGRQMAVLIRNRARPNMPVMGIGLLASPVVRSEARDRWIGWTRESFIETLALGHVSYKQAARALFNQLERSIAELRWDDLVTPEEIELPTERTVWRLQQRETAANEQRAKALREHYDATHEDGVTSDRDAVDQTDENADWLLASEDFLFVAKRAGTLADILYARWIFNEKGLRRAPQRVLPELLESPAGAKAVEIVLREIRKAGLSSLVADVSVCGAIAPYNELIGGKLVALLLTSREVHDFYRDRYGNQISLISSQMAGRPIRRPADLKILTTTSLYGVGNSQYNRLNLASRDHPEISHDIRWRYLKKTKGYGTVHLSDVTVRNLRTIAEEEYGARRVNNRFGEGASPRLRQIREGLDVLGIESDEVLNHATPRRFYACEMVPDARLKLLGFKETNDVPPSPSAAIAAAWRRRWLMKRIQRQDVLDRLAALGPESVRAELLVTDDDGQLALPFGE